MSWELIVYAAENEIIYIGSTNKFHLRFGSDLKHNTAHTLIIKLFNKRIDRKSVVDFLLNTCKYRIELCSTKREAEALEHLTIWEYNPKLNK